jgi:hypothetical protein
MLTLQSCNRSPFSDTSEVDLETLGENLAFALIIVLVFMMFLLE